MDYIKIISGKKVYVSLPVKEDADYIFEWLKAPFNALWCECEEGKTLETIKNDLDYAISNDYNFMLRSKETNEPCISLGIAGLDFRNQSTYLEFVAGKSEYWTDGTVEEALKLILDYCFNILNIYNVTVWAFSCFDKTINCYLKTGFKEIGRRKEFISKFYGKTDIVYFDILADEFSGCDIIKID
jgi:RimJ/RimL family protein N-acetyltransferase